VTGFRKTLCVSTKFEIHLIIHNSQNQALSRHSEKTATDKQVCFYIRLFVILVKLQNTLSVWLMEWSGLLWSPVWPTEHITWLAVSAGSAGFVENVFQNQPV